MPGKSLNIVFMGNPDFSVPSLEQLASSRHRVTAVVTGSDKRRGRGGERSPSPVKIAARRHSIEVIEADDMHSQSFQRKLAALQPDLLVVVAYKLLPPAVLSIPALGSLNLHASLLPKYRGAAPIHWAVISGEKETGCTVFLLDEGMDTGLILNQETTTIDLLETTGDLYERLKTSGAVLLLKTVDEIAAGTQKKVAQDDQQASKAPKITPEDARINFKNDVMDVHNFIRGMSPFPGAWTLHEGRKLKVYRSEPVPGISLEPGRAGLIDGAACAGCIGGSVILREVQPEGRKRMSGTDFLNGVGGNTFFAM